MNNSIDQQFIEYVVKSLVGKPEAVVVERRIDEKGVLLELTVDPEDLGRVIGKRGATAQSLRTLLRALGTKNDARYNLKIIDNGTGGGSYGDDGATDDSSAKPMKSEPAADDAAVVDAEDEGELSVSHDDDEAGSDVVSKTRKELEDLDDLDV
jgi:predicted RNA-binding protein YlqC (UPF0109 family)